MWKFVFCLVPGLAIAQVEQGPANATFTPAFDGQTRAVELPSTDVAVNVFASGLDFPWGIAALPDGQFIVSERGGSMQLIDQRGSLIGAVRGLPEVDAAGQGGLLDVAVSPDFARSGIVYWTYSKPVGRGSALAAARGVLVGDAMTDVADIFIQSPALNSSKHFGSRIVPDSGGVWITSGDRGQSELAQDENSIGKVIWVDGSGPQIYSTGHRNIQGAILRDGELWTVEHGPRGGDELNKPQQGLNYGWPIVSYGIDYSGADVGAGIAVADGFAPPIYYWDPVIAPGGMGAYPVDAAFAAWRGDLLVSSLRPGGVMRLKIENDRVVGEERLLSDVGRVRDVEVLANGDVLVLLDAPNADILRMTPVGGGSQ